MTTMTKARRRVKGKPARSLRFDARTGVLQLAVGDRRFVYHVAAVGTDDGPGVRAFSLLKAPSQRRDGSPDEYTLSVGPGEGYSCECLGHLRWGHRAACKHVAAVGALIARGLI